MVRGETNQRRTDNMKTTMIALACALIAPVAFAQTSTTTTEQTTTTNAAPVTTTERSTTYSAGTVTTYEPGKTIVVRGEGGPLSFALGTAANIVDGAGKIVTAPLRAGQKVRVYYTGPTEKRVVERVVVED
jgi:endonuclease YncB( thermonuclease family)